jgi:hypothetical protein
MVCGDQVILQVFSDMQLMNQDTVFHIITELIRILDGVRETQARAQTAQALQVFYPGTADDYYLDAMRGGPAPTWDPPPAPNIGGPARWWETGPIVATPAFQRRIQVIRAQIAAQAAQTALLREQLYRPFVIPDPYGTAYGTGFTQDAEERAEKLLQSVLTSTQQTELAQRNYFHVKSSNGNVYKVKRKRICNGSFDVTKLDPFTMVPMATYCNNSTARIPEGDDLAAKALLLKFNEDQFLAYANSGSATWDRAL